MIGETTKLDALVKSLQQERGRAIGVGFQRLGEPPQIVTAGPRYIREGQVSVESRWHIGSLTKSMTSAMILRLHDEGVLDIDAPVGDLLPAFQAEMHTDWQSIRLSGLLSHTAGLPANARRDGLPEDPSKARLALMRQLWSEPLKNADPSFEYSNTGYVLAGLVAEQVTGKSWEELIRAEIASPLGLATLGFGAPDGVEDAWGHRRLLGFSWPVNPAGTADNPAWMGPAGTVHLSLSDLMHWGAAHLNQCTGVNPSFLSKESCARLVTPVKDSYALGWVILPRDDGDVLFHNGSNTMWSAMLFVSDARQSVLAMVMNDGRIGWLEKQLPRIIEVLPK